MGNIKLISSKGKKATPKKPGASSPAASKPAASRSATNSPAASRSAASKPAANKSAASRPAASKPPAKKRGSAGKTALIIGIILVLGIAVFTVAMGYYVNKLDTVYPNVRADGVDLSGLTLEEARDALRNVGYESNVDGVAVTIVFPDGGKFTVTGEEAGFSLDAEEAAMTAYDYGRGGSFFRNELEYFKAYFSQTDLREVSKPKYNESYISEAVRVGTKKFNDALIDETYQVTATSITVIKGAGIEPADESEVFELTVSMLFKALEERAHLTADFIPSARGASDVDLDMLYSLISVDSSPATYDPETMEITEESAGVSFDIGVAQAKLDSAGIGTQIVIPFIRIEPEITAKYLESFFYRDELYISKTSIGGTANRRRNITIAALAIDGTILKPGEVFSFNETVGKRTADKGYSEAPAYVSGETVQEIGGGICQVSSTIYNAVLHADLEVVERRCHQFTVAYLPLGNDATVNWGTIDFRFRNSTDYPLRIDTQVLDGVLTVTLVGTKLDENYIKIDYKHIQTIQPQVVETPDESVPKGETSVKQAGHTGHVVDTYKYLYDKDDNLISETRVGRSTYSAQNRIILIHQPSDDDDDDDDETPAETESPSETEPPSETETPTGTQQPGETTSPDDGDSYTEETDGPPEDYDPSAPPSEIPETTPSGNGEEQPSESAGPHPPEGLGDTTPPQLPDL
ncbi:MAG: VanW family protein [Oscillospiraceae bacterium]|nr:VanW family protein [Oscillospiraceae bacterium]